MSIEPWRRWLGILTAFVVAELVSALRVNHSVPSDAGIHYTWSWEVQIALGTFGVIYNSISFTMMMLLENKRKMPFFSLNVSINMMDLLFALGRVVYSSISLAHGYNYGHNTRCLIEALCEITIVLWVFSALVGISWVVRYDICMGKRFTQKNMILYMLAMLVYSFAVAATSIFVPYGGYQLEASGTFCYMTPSSYLGVPIIYFFGVFLPFAFLHYNLMITYKIINQAQEDLKAQGIQEVAKAHYINMVKKLGYFVITTVTFLQPLNLISLYEWATLQYAPADLSAIAGITTMAIPCIVNPTLFFYLNYELRMKFLRVFGTGIAKVLQALGILSYFGSNRMKKTGTSTVLVRSKSETSSKSLGILSINSAKHALRDIAPLTSAFSSLSSKIKNIVHINRSNRINPKSPVDVEGQVNVLDYKSMYTWLSEPDLLKVFQEHGRKQYAMENFLFYEDAREYHFKGLNILALIDELVDGRKLSDSAISALESDWIELEKKGLRLYSLYIKIPTAPLEINIPFKSKTPIVDVFDQSQLGSIIDSKASSNRASVDLDRGESFSRKQLFPAIRDIIKSTELHCLAEKYIRIYDDSIKIIQLILETDVWPRFITTPQYKEAIINHRKGKAKTPIQIITSSNSPLKWKEAR